MRIIQIKTSNDRNFSYIVLDEEKKKGVVIDPSDDVELIIREIRKENLKINYILNTHTHIDHTSGNNTIVKEIGARVLQHPELRDGSLIEVTDELKIEVLYTPGHHDTCCCFLAGKNLFTGDVLFVGNIGGVGDRFPKSDSYQQWKSLQRIIKLEPKINVWPGHDYGTKTRTTIGEEKENNPFILCGDYEEFMNLMNN